MSKDIFYIVDCNSYMHRNYHAIKSLRSSKGVPTNAIYGTTLFLLKLINEYKPKGVIATFDVSRKTFRTELYKEYKAQRKSMEEDLLVQMPIIRNIIESLNIPIVQMQNYEADDVIATLAVKLKEFSNEVYIATNDKDFFQLVDDKIKVVKFSGGDVKVFDRDEVKKQMGIYPEQVPDFLGLTGDSSDNIPGIPKIGEKTARELLEEYGSLENVLANAEKISKPSIRQSLLENKESGILSKKLATVCMDVPIDFKYDELELKTPDSDKVISIFSELELYSLIDLVKMKEKPRETSYKLVKNPEELVSLINELKEKNLIAVDTETTDIDPMKAQIVGISLCGDANKAYYIPIRYPSEIGELDIHLSIQDVLKELKKLLEDEKLHKVGQNIKFDNKILRKFGINVKNYTFDTMIAAYLINPDRYNYNLKELALSYLNIKMTDISELIGSGKKQKTMDTVPLKQITDYACADADVTFQLANLLKGKLKEDGLYELFQDVEMPLSEVLSDMEDEGIKIDVDYFAKLSKEINELLNKLSKEIFDEAGCEFNISSPKQLQDILFNRLNLKPLRKTKTGYSTDVAVLEELANQHKLPALILEYRSFEKLKNTYIDTLPTLVDTKTDKLHTSFNQTITATGRLSSSEPNLQNIPVKGEWGLKIRKGFIPSDNKHKFLSADYSQIELRILAHFSKDKNLVEAFEKNQDIHIQTASKIFNVSEDKVTREMRDQAKTINFGVLYGMSVHRLSNEFKISRTRAQEFIDGYFTIFSGVKKYIEDTIKFVRENGYVKTLLGRKRYIPEINATNKMVQAGAERMAVNSPIQGSAADLIKIAMISIHRKMKEENFKSKLILQVHDELIFDTHVDEIESLSKMVVKEMKEAMKLIVPIRVDTKIGNNWGECK